LAEYTLELNSLCSTVLGVNENIQSVSVINKNGRAVERIIREGTEMPMLGRENEMLLMQCAITISMGRDLDEPLGEIGYVHVERKNLSLFSFPLGDYIVLVTSKTANGSISLAKKISMAFRRYGKSSSQTLDVQKRAVCSYEVEKMRYEKKDTIPLVL
jgi:hypothetical protein